VMRGANVVVLVVCEASLGGLESLVKVLFECHNHTQGMRQGTRPGSQYLSAIYYLCPEQQAASEQLLLQYQRRLDAAGQGRITTEIVPAGPFYYAEEYHQQYLAKNPNGYCGLGGTGVRF